jgi:hypothetical protein
LFGNIVGGLLVAVPFTYFYLRDDPVLKKLEDAEAGELAGQRTLNGSPEPVPTNTAKTENKIAA